MKKTVVIIVTIVASLIVLFGVIVLVDYLYISDNYKIDADRRSAIKIEKLLNEGKITEAYEESNKMYGSAHTKILRVEIANLVSESEEKTNFPKIIFAIKDKGNGYKEWYEYAIEMANIIENTELEEALTKAMDKKFNSKEKK